VLLRRRHGPSGRGILSAMPTLFSAHSLFYPCGLKDFHSNRQSAHFRAL
jgi:hypothetical protein